MKIQLYIINPPPTPHPPRSPVNTPALSLKSELESPSARRIPGPSHRRHVRTIKEVRTTITRIITDVYYEDGKEVERKVSEVTHTHTQGRESIFRIISSVKL